MDFIVGLPRTPRGFDTIWVIVDRLTKVARFIPFKKGWTFDEMAETYWEQIVRYHGVPKTIISDRDTRFLSQFWQQFQNRFGTRIKVSTAYHPQTDGQTERVNPILEDMLRACALDFKEQWDKILSFAEFAYNNSYQASIQMAPYEAMYGRPCRSPTCWEDMSDTYVFGPHFVRESIERIAMIRKRMQAAQDRQKKYADRRRRPLEFQVGDFVLLKVSPMKGVFRFQRKGKLSPRYIGPFEITERIGSRAYRLSLPPELARIHDVFHVSLLKKSQIDPSKILHHVPVSLNTNLTYEEGRYELRIIRYHD